MYCTFRSEQHANSDRAVPHSISGMLKTILIKGSLLRESGKHKLLQQRNQTITVLMTNEEVNLRTTHYE